MTFKTPPLTLAQAKEIARSIHAIRSDWDKPGIEDALARARFLGDPATVAIAAHRAAATHGNRTPAVIALDGPHWRDAEKPPHFPAPTAGERCSTCSEREPVCRARWGDDHEFAPDFRPEHGTASSQVEGLRAIRENRRAELCPHGTPLSNCLECRARRKAAPEPSPAHDVGDRPEQACTVDGCFRPTRDGICDRCRAKAIADDRDAANAALVDRLKANQRERAHTRPAPSPEPKHFTADDIDHDRVRAATSARTAQEEA